MMVRAGDSEAGRSFTTTKGSIGAEVAPGERRKVELTGAHFADFMQPLAAAGELEGSYNVSVGVARVEFTDGTSIDLP